MWLGERRQGQGGCFLEGCVGVVWVDGWKQDSCKGYKGFTGLELGLKTCGWGLVCFQMFKVCVLTSEMVTVCC